MAQALPPSQRQIELDDDGHRHWSPNSESFTPADALLGAFEQGWAVHGHVFQQEHWHTAGRRVLVYHFKLERNDEIMPMVVIENPFIVRLLATLKVRVVRINERKQKTSEERW